MKRFIAVLLTLTLIFSMFAGIACADTIVYITKTGKKYHNSGCSHLSKSKISISLSDAISRGYTPCADCHAPSGVHTHTWNNGIVTTDATCSKAGVRTYTCTSCKQTRTETIPATGIHTWNSGKISTSATCTKTGIRTYTCTSCGKTKTESIPATGIHTWNGGTVTAESTCTKTGIRTYACTSCGQTKTESIPINPNAHAWVCTQVLSAPENDQHGYGIFTCERCKKTKSDEICPSSSYSDVKNDWSHKGIDYCVLNGYMNGTSSTVFSPNATVTRAQLVTILYRVVNAPEVTSHGTFIDVSSNLWYSDAVEWAVSNDIVNGVGAGKFNPMGKITREQIAAILYRYFQSPNITGSLEAFPDGDTASPYAKDALIWATQNGLINGIKSGNITTLAPKATATRAQIASIIMRFPSYIENNLTCEHDYQKGDPTLPTCITSGGITYTCVKCGDSYIDDEVSALGHDFDPLTHVCTRCGELEACR